MSEGVKHVLRGTYGPHAGSVIIIDRPLMLGRAPDADIQILDDGVSRQHAQLRIEADGGILLVDLHSGTGTKVGGRRVDRKRLRPGETVQIGEARFVFETKSGDFMNSPSFVEKTHSAEALHRTNPGLDSNRGGASGAEPSAPRRGATGVYAPGAGGAVPASPPAGAPPPAGSRAAPRAPAPETTPEPEPEPPSQHRGAVFRDIQASAPRSPLTWEQDDQPVGGPGLPTVDSDAGVSELAELFQSTQAQEDERREPSGRFSLSPDPVEEEPAPVGGPTIQGPQYRALIERVLHYHELAARITRNEPLDDVARQALAGLETEFRDDPALSESRRQWRRFPVRAQADAVWFRNLTSRSVAIHLSDVSAAGLRFQSNEEVFAPGDVLSLLLTLPGVHDRQAVFSGRVAWVSKEGDRCGAVFVGPGSWQQGR